MILSASECDGVAGNLVANCGFESGDLTSWTRAGDTSYSGIDYSSHTGTYAYGAGPVDGNGTLSQTIAVENAATYRMSFWLRGGGSGIYFDAQADPDGSGPDAAQTLMTSTSAPANWTKYTFQFVATGTSATLTFTFFNEPSYWYLDDVSLVKVGLTNPGFETGDFTGWATNSPPLSSVVTTFEGWASTRSPAEGTYFAVLQSGVGPNVWTVVSQPFTAEVGTTIAGSAFFSTYECSPYYADPAEVVIQTTGGTPVATPYSENAVSAGCDATTPWTPWSYTFTTAGTYQVLLRVANYEDNTVPSWLGVDGISLTTEVPTTTTTTVQPSSQQYSDTVTLTATLDPSEATGAVQFQKSTDDGATFTDLGSSQNVSDGTASLSDVQILDPAGTPVKFRAVFTGTGVYVDSTSDPVALTVTKEDASILYGSGNPVSAVVSAPGSGSATGPFTFTVNLKETYPDASGGTGGSAGLGDITNAGLSLALAPVAGGSAIPATCVAGTSSGSGYNTVQPYTCTVSGSVALGTYEVDATVTGDYYTGTYMDAFTVFDPSLGFATGGGTYLLNGEKVNFGFTMKYNKSGANLQGNLIAVRHHSDGTVSRIKSNALGGLALLKSGSCDVASFNGKSTYTTWDIGLGAYVTSGGQPFAVYAQDCGEPGTGVDKMWMRASGDLNSGGNATTSSQVLTGGNIAVPHRGK